MNKKVVIFIILIACVLGLAGFWAHLKFSKPTLPKGKLTIGSHAYSVDIAETMAARAQGLSGRAPLAAGEGMVFLFGKPARTGFWMKDMNFALDMVWILNGKVAGISANVPAPAPGQTMFTLPIYYPPDQADTVLELTAGTAARDGLKAGDAVTLSR